LKSFGKTPSGALNSIDESLTQLTSPSFPNAPDALATSLPAESAMPPENVFAPERTRVPVPVFFMPPSPEMTPEYLDGVIKKYHFTGLKPYRLYAKDPANCRIADYLPESLIEVADDNSLCITMHMSRFDGIADKENLADLKYFTAKYKNVRWILAHCARAFNSYTLEKNIFILRDMPNLNYDLSAVCDCRSHYLLFKHENLSRIMFGTDNIDAGGVHAKYITWGKGWQYFTGMDVPHCRKEATYVCYEGLRSIKQAADMAGLNRKDIEDIFFNNAMRFFSISNEKVCSN
jgi:glutamate-1-semialdehyde 2,1-aminomutase